MLFEGPANGAVGVDPPQGSGDVTRVDLDAIGGAVRDAIGHAADLARIGSWEVGERLRSVLFRIALGAILAAAAVAVVITASVWLTLGFLREISESVGGGLPGFALGAGSALLVAGAAALLARGFIARARAARFRAEPRGKPPAARRDDPLEQLKRRTLDELRRDRERLVGQVEELGRAHPLASLGTAAAVGFVTARIALRPRRWRRLAVAAVRLTKRALRIARLAVLVIPDPRGREDGVPVEENGQPDGETREPSARRGA